MDDSENSYDEVERHRVGNSKRRGKLKSKKGTKFSELNTSNEDT